MALPIYIDSIQELPEVFASVQEDFDLIEFQPFMEKQLGEIADFERGLFEKQTSPDGSAWAPNAQSTINRKGHSNILRGIRGQRPSRRAGVRSSKTFARFRLSNSLTLKTNRSTEDATREAVETSTGGWLAFGTTVPYSVYHDRGTSRFPARQHVGINEEMLDGMTERFADYVLDQLVKG